MPNHCTYYTYTNILMRDASPGKISPKNSYTLSTIERLWKNTMQAPVTTIPYFHYRLYVDKQSPAIADGRSMSVALF